MIKPLATPPVEELPVWSWSAEKILARVGVRIIGDFTNEGVTIRRLLLAALQNAATTLWSPRRDQWARAAASEAKNGRLGKRPYLRVRWGVWNLTYLSWNSINVRFAILLTLCCKWPTVPKACATPTGNAHVSPVGSKVIGMHSRISTHISLTII